MAISKSMSGEKNKANGRYYLDRGLVYSKQ